MDSRQRFTPERPCPICGGNGRDRPHCHGFYSEDCEWAYCTGADGGDGALLNEKCAPPAYTYRRAPSGTYRPWTKDPPAHATPMREATAKDGKTHPRSVGTRYFPYADGQRVARTDYANREKEIRPQHLTPQGEWANGNGPGKIQRIYPPAALDSGPDATVFGVEGEGVANALTQVGITAFTLRGGCGQVNMALPQLVQAAPGKDFVLIPDDDTEGRAAMAKTAAAIHPVARSVKVLALYPEGETKRDAEDWLHEGGTADGLRALAEGAAPYEPPEATASRVASGFKLTALDDLLDEAEEEIAYVLDKTLPGSGVGLLIAKPKVGKSVTARNLAVAVARGEPFLGRETVQGTVIYLALEEKRGEIARHFRRMGATGLPIYIYTGATPEDALAALAAAIAEHSPVLIIVDPLSRLIRIGDFNAYGEATRALEPLIDLARASTAHILCVHHAGKGIREDDDAVLGSTAIFGAVDVLLHMKKREAGRTIQTTQRYGEDLPETVLVLESSTGIITEGGDLAELERLKARAKVVEIVAANTLTEEERQAKQKGGRQLTDDEIATGKAALTEGEIKELVGGNTAKTQRAIRELVEQKKLQRDGEGKKNKPYTYRRPDAHFSVGSDPDGDTEMRNEHPTNADNQKPVSTDAHLLISSYKGNEEMSKMTTSNAGAESLIPDWFGQFRGEAAGDG